MLNRLADKVAGVLSENSIVSKEDKEIYTYGLEVILSTVVNLVVVILLGCIFDFLLPTMLFVLFFAVLRVYAGGYHAKTHFGCIATFTLLYIVNMLLHLFTPEDWKAILSVSLSVIAFISIFIMAPIEHPNRPFEGDEFKRFRKISRVVSIFELVVVIGFIAFLPGRESIAYTIALAMISVIFILVLAKIIKK